MRGSGWRTIGLALLLTLAYACSAPVAAQALKAELLETEGELKQPPRSAPIVAHWQVADAGDILYLGLPRRAHGYWLRLSTDRDIAADERRLLLVRGARTVGQDLYYPPTGAPRTVNDTEHGKLALLHRGWVLALPDGWKRGDVAYLRIDGNNADALNICFITSTELSRRETGDSRFMIAAFATMLLMAAAMLMAWVMLRDSVYLFYSAYQASIALYLVLLFGDTAKTLWGLSGMTTGLITLGWTLATLATIFQLGFSRRFLELPRTAPRLDRAAHALQWLNILWLAVLLALRERAHGYWYIGGNALLLIAIPLLLTSAVVAWRGGAKYAGYYLLGWTPLMLFAGLLAGYTFGVGRAEWSDRGLVVAVVLESGVLVLALTQHAAERHRRLRPERGMASKSR